MFLRYASFWATATAITLLGTACRSLPFHASEGRIRESILVITPLGTSLQDVKKLILTRIRPETLNEETVFPGKLLAGNIGTTNKWPLPFLALSCTHIEGHWIFSSTERLTEVFVHKQSGGIGEM